MCAHADTGGHGKLVLNEAQKVAYARSLSLLSLLKASANELNKGKTYQITEHRTM